ncbi:MAG: hypothetical protein ACREF9_19295, partial [Opitutaceae bacterium]
LKPYKNAEASGYSLGFWKSLEEASAPATTGKRLRWQEGPELSRLPAGFETMEMISAARGNPTKPGIPYNFSVNQPVTVHLLVENAGGYAPDGGWTKTDQAAAWLGGADTVFRREFPAGEVTIPEHTGKSGARFGVPHLVFVQPSASTTFKAMIGVNVPIQIRSEFLALERAAADLKPGHWIFNPYNWNAVGSFVRRLPWDSIAVTVDEAHYDPDARIFAFKRPNGKLTVVVSNRTAGERAFEIETGGASASWVGFRYTPDAAGEGTLGIRVGRQTGKRLRPTLPRLSWEFWEEQ